MVGGWSDLPTACTSRGTKNLEMKVLNISSIMVRSITGGKMTLGGEFTGGESSWWRGDHKPSLIGRLNWKQNGRLVVSPPTRATKTATKLSV